MASNKDYLKDIDKYDGKKQLRPFFKRKRGGVVLSREQVRAIKKARKELRKEMKKRGIKSREEFEVMASAMSYYYDRNHVLPFWLRRLRGLGFWALLGSLLALLGALFIYATVSELRGHFTINMSDGMFREGFVLSETADFARPTTNLFCDPAQDVPCVSINSLPENVDTAFEGQHNENYFAYTYFIRNEGESTVNYTWTVALNSESQDLSKACWVMIFEDGKMAFYAEPSASGETEALPAFDDNRRGYVGRPMAEFAKEPEKQYQLIATRGSMEYYRLVPKDFLSDTTIAAGRMNDVDPGETHKYTVVIWIEGDDPDCTDELIGGHLGMQMDFRTELEEEEGEKENGILAFADDLWQNLKFWQEEEIA